MFCSLVNTKKIFGKVVGFLKAGQYNFGKWRDNGC